MPEILDAFYREIIEFEPVGLVTQARLVRFMERYNNEIRCLFANPFIGIRTPEQLAAQRTDVLGYTKMLEERGILPRRKTHPKEYGPALIAAFDLRQAEMAYQQAHTRSCCTDPPSSVRCRPGVRRLVPDLTSDAHLAFQAEPGPPSPHSKAEAQGDELARV